MSDTFHFPFISYVRGNLRVEIRLDRFEKQFTEAQQWLGDTALQDSKRYMTKRAGNMAQRSYTKRGGRRIVFPGPYSRMQWGGFVMVDPETGSPWARKGAKKVVTKRRLKYGKKEATAEWFKTAKKRHGNYWISEVKRRAGGG